MIATKNGEKMKKIKYGFFINLLLSIAGMYSAQANNPNPPIERDQQLYSDIDILQQIYNQLATHAASGRNFQELAQQIYEVIIKSLQQNKSYKLYVNRPLLMGQITDNLYSLSKLVEPEEFTQKVRAGLGQGIIYSVPRPSNNPEQDYDIALCDMTFPLITPSTDLAQLYFTLFGLVNNDDTFETIFKALNQIYQLNIPARNQTGNFDFNSAPVTLLSSGNYLHNTVGQRAQLHLEKESHSVVQKIRDRVVSVFQQRPFVQYEGMDKERVELLRKHFFTNIRISTQLDALTSISRDELLDFRDEARALERSQSSYGTMIKNWAQVSAVATGLTAAGLGAAYYYTDGELFSPIVERGQEIIREWGRAILKPMVSEEINNFRPMLQRWTKDFVATTLRNSSHFSNIPSMSRILPMNVGRVNISKVWPAMQSLGQEVVKVAKPVAQEAAKQVAQQPLSYQGFDAFSALPRMPDVFPNILGGSRK